MTPRKANRSLNQKPKFANLIPADLAFPLLIIAGLALIAHLNLSIPASWCIAITIWLGATYWIFVGDKPWLHISKLITKVPTWGTAQAKYHNIHPDIPRYKKPYEPDN